MSKIREERRYAWISLTPGELLSLIRGETRIGQVGSHGLSEDAEILAIETGYGSDGVDTIKIGLASSHFAPVHPSVMSPTIDWKPEPNEARKIKFREFF